jgi:hypothetical protein
MVIFILTQTSNGIHSVYVNHASAIEGYQALVKKELDFSNECYTCSIVEETGLDSLYPCRLHRTRFMSCVIDDNEDPEFFEIELERRVVQGSCLHLAKDDDVC